MDVLLDDRLFNCFADAKGSIAGGVEILGRGVQHSLLAFPCIDLLELNEPPLTSLVLSTSETLTMCPKEGMTLILILLNEMKGTRLLKWCFGMTSQLLIIYISPIKPIPLIHPSTISHITSHISFTR